MPVSKLAPGTNSDRWKDDPRYVEIERPPTQRNDAVVNCVHSPVSSRADAKNIVQETWGTIVHLGEPRSAEDQALRALQEALSPDPIELTSKESDALRQGVEALPPKAKLALLMVRQDGLSYKEVGRKLGVTTNTAQRLVERAMEYLLEVVTEER